jgi:predicted oxidoreductase
MLGIDWNGPDFVARTVPVIRAAYEHGITFFDLADVYGYGKAEVALGQVLKASPGLRNKIIIQSKCGDRFVEGGTVDNSRDHIITSVEGSLQRLGTDRLDLLLLHWPDNLVEPEVVAAAFDELHESGKVRYFGVSNHNPVQIQLIQKYVRQRIVANQIHLGLLQWYATPHWFRAALMHGDEGVVTLEYCRLHEIQVQAYSPLRTLPVPNAPNLLNPAPDGPSELKDAAKLLADIAQQYDATPSAILLAWLLRHPANIIPVMGSTQPKHVIEGCAADRIDLSRVEWYKLLHGAATIGHPKTG